MPNGSGVDEHVRLTTIAVERTLVAQRAATEAREALLNLQRAMAGGKKRPNIPEVWELVREKAQGEEGQDA